MRQQPPPASRPLRSASHRVDYHELREKSFFLLGKFDEILMRRCEKNYRSMIFLIMVPGALLSGLLGKINQMEGVLLILLLLVLHSLITRIRRMIFFHSVCRLTGNDACSFNFQQLTVICCLIALLSLF